MKKHTRVYLKVFRYGEQEFIPCEICGRGAKDLHHIHARGMGGSKEMDYIENLMALCRECHIEYGDKEEFISILEKIHGRHLHLVSKEEAVYRMFMGS